MRSVDQNFTHLVSENCCTYDNQRTRSNVNGKQNDYSQGKIQKKNETSLEYLRLRNVEML